MVIYNQVLKTIAPVAIMLCGAGYIAVTNTHLAIAQTPVPQLPISLPINGELVPLDNQLPQPQPPQPQPPQPNSDETVPTPAFSFTNMLEYGDCLEIILKLHENSGVPIAREQQNLCFIRIQATYGDDGLSNSEALRLVSAADFYATTLLSRELYPPRGQRVRIASLFGFIYAIDVNDSHIRALAAQAPTQAECRASSNCI